MRPSPLQNRIDPFGEIHATSERGLFYGNRGGRFHCDDRTLGTSRWKSRQWITCLCAFKGRRNDVFGKRYTDLFFMDEPTALAAGHRPCFECRRPRALAYRKAVDPTERLRAGDLDRLLDAERRTGRAKKLHDRDIDELPDGAIYAEGRHAFAIRGESVLSWSFAGYRARQPRPQGRPVACLTPPTSLAALSAGYAPEWGPDAEAMALSGCATS